MLSERARLAPRRKIGISGIYYEISSTASEKNDKLPDRCRLPCGKCPVRYAIVTDTISCTKCTSFHENLTQKTPFLRQW